MIEFLNALLVVSRTLNLTVIAILSMAMIDADSQTANKGSTKVMAVAILNIVIVEAMIHVGNNVISLVQWLMVLTKRESLML